MALPMGPSKPNPLSKALLRMADDILVTATKDLSYINPGPFDVFAWRLLRQQRVGLGLVEGHQRSPGCAWSSSYLMKSSGLCPSNSRRGAPPRDCRIEIRARPRGSAADLVRAWAGTRAVVECVLKYGGVIRGSGISVLN
jgi:hypothetical protein